MTIRRSLLFVVTVVISCCFDQTCCLPTNPKVVECKGIKLTKVGCFEDRIMKPRPLPQLMFTDRDITSPVYSNVRISWRRWDEYMADLICRCAAMSLAKGYDRIGLQHYGECWSGPKSATSNYARDGPSRHCITFGGKPCKGGLDCIGEDRTNFVYRVKVKPSGSPTRKPTTKETTPTTPKTTPTKTPSTNPSSPSTLSSSTPSPSTPSTSTPSPSTPSPSTPSPSSPSPSSPSPSSSPTPSSGPSPTPSGSATSTAKRPSSKPTSSKPCQSSSCSNTGQQQPCQYPPCQPQQPVAYPGVTGVCPQAQCPSQCAPQCTLSCCNLFK